MPSDGKLRRKALGALRETKAIALFTRPMTPDEIARMATAAQDIAEASGPALLERYEFYQRQLEELRHGYGASVSRDDLLTVLSYIEAAPSGLVTYAPYWILRRWFGSYRDHLATVSKIPCHAFIGIDATGQMYERRSTEFEVRLLEASLFEDMCALFNLVANAQAGRNTGSESIIARKERLSLQRATILAAFNVVEAYLNGIAFDFLETNESQLSESAESLLSEWDATRQRRRYLSLRDKLLQYPKVVTGTEHPPLHEDNCPELKFVVETAKRFRDAIVHASPAPDALTGALEKEIAVHGVQFETVERLVDATIALIRKVDQIVYGSNSAERLRFWLHDRPPGGTFSDAVFE
jgi:hypothetical protein